MALVALLYQYFTNPEAVRRQVLARIQNDLVNVNATLESARLRLFGGIDIRELRMSRKDDLDKTDFLSIPSATIYHDKEQVLENGIHIRKVEIRRPRLRAVREHDGSWNLAGLVGPSDLNHRAPTIIIQEGVLLIEDRQAPGSLPLEIHDIALTMINDPLPIVTLEGSGICDGAGEIQIRGKMTRGGGPISLTVEAPNFTLGGELVQRLASYCPDAAVHLRQLNAHVRLSAHVNWDSRAEPALSWSISGEVTDGQFSHARLPWPLEKLRGSFHCANGMCPEVLLAAVAGPTRFAIALKDLRLGGAGASWADRLGSLELRADHFPVNSDLFKYLPAGLQVYQTDYSPTGMASLRLDLQRISPRLWKQTGVLTAEGMDGIYTYFRYPVSKVCGTIDWCLTTDMTGVTSSTGRPEDRIRIDLHGEAGGKAVFLKGHTQGERNVSAIEMDIWGNDVPLDSRLLAALR
jgi:hypothetical protein